MERERERDHYFQLSSIPEGQEPSKEYFLGVQEIVFHLRVI